MKPQKFIAKLEDKNILNDKFTHFCFELVEPHVIDFLPGQYVSIKIDNSNTRRSYSICSSSDINHGFELLVDMSGRGRGVTYLDNLQFGQDIEVLAPLGDFLISADEQKEKNLMFVATGSGIAPIYSMLQFLLQQKADSRPIVFLWGMRYESQLFWLEEIQELSNSYPNFKFSPVISRPSDRWTLSQGRVTDYLSAVKLNSNTGYYICGRKKMIDDVEQILHSKGVDSSFINYEDYDLNN